MRTSRIALTRVMASSLLLTSVTCVSSSFGWAHSATPTSVDQQNRHELTSADVEAFLDGLVPLQLSRNDIVGATVTVVKDGKLIFAKGYSYSNVGERSSVSAEETLFRVGSISKLFTWTAVMQLFEQGKLDLNRDVLLLLASGLSFRMQAQSSIANASYDVVFSNGRVIDPETRLDAVRNVGIKNGKIAAISVNALNGRIVVDATGLIVSPGFIDWHAHGQSTLADRVQAFDGVTTTLELEAGMLPISRWYDLQARRKRVLNYGASASWGVARMATLEGIRLPGEPRAAALFANFKLKKWTNDVATPQQVDTIVNLVEQGLKEGGLGVGVVPGYAPGSGYKELLAIHELAARYGVPTYSHVRSEGDVDPLSAAQAYGEALSFAAATGANIHICHLNSTSFRDMPMAVSMIHQAIEEGLKVTVEAYPYGAASTAIGAKFLDPDNLRRVGMTYESIEYQGKRLNESSFNELRAKNPGAVVVPHFYELPRDQALLDMAVLFPGGIIASDAMPWTSTRTGQEIDPNVWPLPDDAFSHPRSAGTFTHFLADDVRERRLISWSDALAKTSYLPAKYLQDIAPQMKTKGRLQVGMDADITLFDPTTVSDRATYERPNQVSVGVKDVLVNGVFVIRNGELDTKVFPGKPIRRANPAVDQPLSTRKQD